MVTLKEAIALCDIRENEVVFLRKDGESYLTTIPMTLKEIRNKYDMKRTMVSKISPHFCCEDFKGMELAISG